ncbi:hypothetical protein O6H91_10G069500 [Diphasiastrum complanatum]|uniref:Uncharacterized protein n=1 Tax=Diphasiastrum complanatum TaxID=34168 RepID=A0ACC2CI06_DIPCM|nr:hypothetical protein O6H91_10G069500 [Diphasiastrum complanatum]
MDCKHKMLALLFILVALLTAVPTQGQVELDTCENVINLLDSCMAERSDDPIYTIYGSSLESSRYVVGQPATQISMEPVSPVATPLNSQSAPQMSMQPGFPVSAPSGSAPSPSAKKHHKKHVHAHSSATAPSPSTQKHSHHRKHGKHSSVNPEVSAPAPSDFAFSPSPSASFAPLPNVASESPSATTLPLQPAVSDKSPAPSPSVIDASLAPSYSLEPEPVIWLPSTMYVTQPEQAHPPSSACPALLRIPLLTMCQCVAGRPSSPNTYSLETAAVFNIVPGVCSRIGGY